MPSLPTGSRKRNQSTLDHGLPPASVENKKQRTEPLQERDSIQETYASELLSSVTEPAVMSRLPFEILSQVFEECVKASGNSAPCFVMVFVCQRWREVALGSPTLWTSITVPSFRLDMDDESIKRQTKLLSLWLSFSSTMPLHVKHNKPARQYKCCIDAMAKDPSNNEAVPVLRKRAEWHAIRMLTALVGKQERWKSLEISFDEPLLRHFDLLRQQQQRCDTSSENACLGSSLQYLKVRLCDSHRHSGTLGGLIEWLKELPALETLHLQDPSRLIKDITAIPFAGIPSVIFDRSKMPFVDCVQVMSQCTSVNQVVLFGRHLSNADGNIPMALTPSIHDRKFQTLYNLTRVRLQGVQFPIDLLNYFTLPSLVTLEIVLCFTPCLGKSSFMAFLDRSQCPLVRLIVRDDNLTEGDVIPLFQIPTLQKALEVDFSSVSKSSAPANTGSGSGGDRDQTLNHQTEGINFKMWRKSGERKYRGYHYGWKELADDEELEFVCRNGVIIQC